MSTLPPELVQALDQAEGKPLRLVHPSTSTEYVLIRADVYERVKDLRYDDSDWTPEELDTLAAEMFDRLDHPEKIQ
jgi:hypothetical protein